MAQVVEPSLTRANDAETGGENVVMELKDSNVLIISAETFVGVGTTRGRTVHAASAAISRRSVADVERTPLIPSLSARVATELIA